MQIKSIALFFFLFLNNPHIFFGQDLADMQNGPLNKVSKQKMKNRAHDAVQPQKASIVYRPDVGQSNSAALAALPQFNPVMRFYYRGGQDGSAYYQEASAVLISPGWLLTAAHVISYLDQLQSPTFGENLATNGLYGVTASPFAVKLEGTLNGTNITGVTTLSEVFAFPEHSSFIGMGDGYDLALARLTPGINSVSYSFLTNNYVPAQIYEGSLDIGQVGTWVGYGQWGSAAEGGVHNPSTSPKLACQNIIDSDGSMVPFRGAQLDQYGFWYLPGQGYFGSDIRVAGPFGSTNEIATDFDDGTAVHNALGSSDILPLEGGIAPGDSGGGLFIQVVGTNYVAGITARVSCDTNGSQCNIPTGYGSVSFATRVSHFANWINDHISYSSCQAVDGSSTQFNTPGLWYTGSATNFPENLVPGPQHNIVFNNQAFTVTNVGGVSLDGLQWLQPVWPVPNRRATYTIALDQARTNTRLRVRRGTDVTFDLDGFDYTLSSTSLQSAALVVGQYGSDAPVITITNGTFRAHDCHIAEWGDVPPWAQTLELIGIDDSLANFYKRTCSGTINVRGAGGRLVIDDSMFIGGNRKKPGGVGYLNIDQGGQLSVGGLLRIWYVADIAAEHWDCVGGCRSFARKTIQGAVSLSDSKAYLGALDIAGGALGGNGDVIVTNVTTWRGGNISGGGKLDARGGMLIRGGEIKNPPLIPRIPQQSRPDLVITSPPLVLDEWCLTNHGEATFSGSLDLVGRNSCKFVNLATGTFDVQADKSIVGSGTFANEGLFRKSAGTNTTTVSWVFINSGTVQVEGGSLLFSGVVPQIANSVLSTGTWNVLNGATFAAVQSGGVRTNRGAVLLNGVAANFTNVNSLLCNEGAFTLRGGRSFATEGDLINLGAVTIGDSSALLVNGAFEQASNGLLKVELSGQPDQPPKVVSTLPAFLGGQLEISFSATPTRAQTIEILNFPSSSGTFDAIRIPTLPGATIQTVFSPTNVSVIIVPALPMITTFSLESGTNASLSWVGGSPPFILQMTTNFSPAFWESITGPLTNMYLSVPVSNDSVFFRILSQ